MHDKSSIDPNNLFYNSTSTVSPLDELKDLGITLMRGIQTINDIEDFQKTKRKVYFSSIKIEQDSITIK